MKQWLVRRGLLATVPLATLAALAFGACSSDSTTPNTPSGTDAATKPAAGGGEELATSPAASQRLTRLNRQFNHLPAELKEPPLRIPPGALPPKPRAVTPVAAPRAVLSKGEAVRFLHKDGRVRADVEASLKKEAIQSASVDLPLKANGRVRVQADNSPIGVEFSANGSAEKVEVEVADGVATYPGAAPGGGDIVYRVTRDSVEDFVILNQKPAQPFVDYTVDVQEVAGLRLYDNTLEFLDPSGDPQIRVRPPRVYDSDGVGREAKLSLPNCKADTNGEVPWNRPVTAPGANECTVRVSWDDKNVVYPAIVDPVWQTAGSLATARYRNAAVKLSTGSILVCGGINDLGIAIASCEVFNPAGGVGGAGAWAAATSMGTARNDFSLISLAPASPTNVLAVGGTGISTSERFNGTNAWTASIGDFSTGYFYPQMAAPTSDGNYVVLVDSNCTPYRFTTASNTWSVGTTNPTPIQPYRYDAQVLTIPSQGTILRIGGYYSSTYLNSGERYKPSTDSWTSPGNSASMTVPRDNPAFVALDNNRLMIYGGYTGAVWSSSAEIYNASANTWSFTTGPMPGGGSASQGSRGLTAAFHGSGKLLSSSDQGMYIYDPVAAATPWTQMNTYNFGFYSLGSQGNVVAAGAKVLMVPVQPQGSSGAQTACKLFDFGDKGSVCSTTAECQSGLSCVAENYNYVDGNSVCCDTTCTDACSSCRAANKVSGVDGVCGPRKADQYVGQAACPYTDQTTCGTRGYYCDGLGACAKWSATTQCGGGGCVDTDTQNNQRLCDGKGTCPAQTTADCTTGYQCVGDATYGNCVTNCYGDGYCASTYYCQTWSSPAGTANQCLVKKGSGVACSYNTECGSGFCSDGVCCDGACNGTCEACTNALTGKTTGLCKPVTLAAGKQPDCYDNGAANCGETGFCSGTAAACQLYASGTQCADIGSCQSETVRYIPDTCNGTGTCTDKGTQACTAGYSCQAGVCNTQCTSDANCASAYYCDVPNKLCVPDKAAGQACLRDQACQGNSNCVEIDAITKLGVCCSSACAGDCQSCLTVNTGAADGTCSNVLDDLDPKNKCATGAAYPNSCASPGLCNGQGACRAYAKNGIECDTDVCTDSTLTTYQCNGAGTCKAQATQCYPFKCDTANNVCRVACSIDAHCVTGSSCENGTCVGQLANGEGCTRGPQCKTGFCANIGQGVLQGAEDTGAGGDGAGGAAGDPGADSPGVCCDTECQGTCSGCKASVKGFGSDGVCEFVKNNTDPANDCEKSATDACGLDGQCNGSGACRLAPSGSSCGASSCQGNSVLGQSCNGQGDCVNNQGGIDCAPYVCRDVMGAFQCTNPCAEDNDCQDGYFCSDDAKCSKKLANGKTCDNNGICGSGYCVDGVCCDAACNGQCEACAAPGSEGTCTPIQGEPQGMRPKCDHAGEECGGLCDGVNAAACKYKPNGDACGTPTCDNDLAKSSSCNGQGECKANKNTECSPYTCGTDDVCLERCEQDADCGQGYACDETTQRCLPSASAATCSEDRLVSQGQNGADTPCKPFLCVPASGTCAVSCAFTTDCSPDFVCEPSTKTCLPAPADGGGSDDTSCACRAAGAAPKSSGYLALAALGVALTGLRRRKRSRKAALISAKPSGFASASQPSE